MVEFRIPRRVSRVKSSLAVLDFRRADFGLFKDLLRGVPQDKGLEAKKVTQKLVNIEGSPSPSLRLLHPNDGAQCTLSQSAADTKLGGVPDKPDSQAAIQRDLNSLEKWLTGTS
ncbi:hypothetical protein BTVI_64528 [Pitangus sulphuratus]|nr:hypothetical protein BTVI_64528 [Pitangus sulphuratus]